MLLGRDQNLESPQQVVGKVGNSPHLGRLQCNSNRVLPIFNNTSKEAMEDITRVVVAVRSLVVEWPYNNQEHHSLVLLQSGAQSEYQGRGVPQPRGGILPQKYYGGSRSGGNMAGGGQPGALTVECQGCGRPQPRDGSTPQMYYGGNRSGGNMAAGNGAGPESAGPSRLLDPELHQATHIIHEVAQASSSQVSSLQPSEMEVSQKFQKLFVQRQATPSAAIQSVTKAMRFSLRPGQGTIGIKCTVKANHFFAELPNKDLHQYDVSITPEVTSRGVNRAVMEHQEQLVKLYKETHLGGCLPAYDGRKSLYTAGPLPFTSREFQIVLVDDDGSGTSDIMVADLFQMEAISTFSLPPGFGFHPTDMELISHYLKRKILGLKIDFEVIVEVKYEPWDLPGCRSFPNGSYKHLFSATRIWLPSHRHGTHFSLSEEENSSPKN